MDGWIEADGFVLPLWGDKKLRCICMDNLMIDEYF
jgi:hypothetical protein